ncbi:MAG: AAC(3) family N-acetyltransferase [Anaerolineales bacterium]
MNLLTESQLIKLLLELGLQRGDGVLVHSALHFLGKPEGGVGMYYQALASILDLSENEIESPSAGTLAVPTFNFAFARGEPFDLMNTPSVGMGAFSEYIRQKPSALRTPHPMQSIAVIGRYAEELAGRDTPSAFDPGSAFERMVELDFKILLLGADVQAISLLHYAEQRVGVPYRYWKDFPGLVRLNQDWEERIYRMYVRDLDLDPHIDLHPVQRRMEERCQWISQPLNYGVLSVCRMRDFVNAVEEFLREDPWSLVTNRPG